ncbi:MAG TPA: hypothetical protein VGO96_13755 [Pyrinomonadaceae bacterium]|jgi:hypothetical protein|nr:hypothetical protein [Pyrinomonadaceae bacterium]
MTVEWTPEQTGTHQDHVIAHVLGATVLGYFKAEDALHLALDIGFIWTIFADAEMGLVPESLALKELNISEAERARLFEELRHLHEGEAAGAATFAHVTPAPEGCLIEEVRLLSQDELRRLEIQGEMSALVVYTSTITGEMSIEELQL